jgi:hypothetical protein
MEVLEATISDGDKVLLAGGHGLGTDDELSRWSSRLAWVLHLAARLICASRWTVPLQNH